MELKRIEIMGFKSFPEKISIEFSSGITAIVGPNGSGKSNISDAIRWVLGEQSVKSLRGSRMEDVIFAGTERRRPMSYAQVSLVLNNSDHKISLDYDEISIMRRVYRSGESEYSVNGTKYRLKDIQEMLMDTGIGKNGYSIIGQGHIDQLLSNRPQERRVVFEEAAGIVKFKTRRDEALKQLDVEQAALERVNDRLKDLEERLPGLKEQAEKAKAYQTLSDELKTYEIHHFLGQYQNVRKQYDQAEENLNNLKMSLQEAAEKRQAAKDMSARLAEEAEQARAAAGENETRLSQARVDLEALDADKKLKEQEKAHLEQDMKSAKQHVDEIKERLRRLSQTVETEEDTLKKLQLEDQEKEQQQLQKNDQDRELSKELLKLGQEIMTLSHQKDQITNQRQSLEKQLERHKAWLEQRENQAEGSDEQLIAMTRKEQEQKTEEEALQNQQDSLLRQHEDAEGSLSDAQAQLEALREDVKKLHENQEENLRKIRSLKDRIRLLKDLAHEYEGYAGSVKMIMRFAQENPGVHYGIHGTVGELITVPQELSLALNVVLGPAVGHIVVDRQDDAKKLIALLKKQKGGRATFQPLDTVRGRDHGNREKNIRAMMQKDSRILGFADELIQYDACYQNVIQRLLAWVIVVEDFDTGAILSRSESSGYRIVTKDGDLFNPGGSITGGSAAHESGVLGRTAERREAEASLDRALHDNDAFRKISRQYAEKSEALSKHMQSLRQQLQDLEEQQQKVREALIRIRLQLQQTGSQKQQYIEEHEMQTMEADDIRAQIQRLTQELETVLKQEEEFNEKNQRILNQQLEKRQESDQLHQDLMQLKMERGSISQQQQSLRRTMEWEYHELEDYSGQADRWLSQNAEHRERVQALNEELKQIEAQYAGFMRQIEGLKSQSSVLHEAQKEKEAQREEKIAQSEASIQAYAELEKEQIRLESVYNRARKDMTALQDDIWEKYELTYNAALRMDLSVNLDAQAESRRISKLTHDMKALGPVNLSSIEEYETLSERFAIDTAQRDDIVKAQESLEEIIRHLNRKMEKQFEERFEQIAVLFDKVFRRLFGGGRGILKLTESENGGVLEAGIDIIAQPPGKKLQNMMLLSGGERALTAIALLFAIQELSPAPFCVLDEIDAALDDSNVTRFAGYLTELSGKTQYIVITHRKGTMEAAHTIYGVTMEEKGISKGFSMQFTDAEEMEWNQNGTV